jgi:hypothetical protein
MTKDLRFGLRKDYFPDFFRKIRIKKDLRLARSKAWIFEERPLVSVRSTERVRSSKPSEAIGKSSPEPSQRSLIRPKRVDLPV